VKNEMLRALPCGVKDSAGELSEAEEYVLEFGRTTCDMLSRPIVELNI